MTAGAVTPVGLEELLLIHQQPFAHMTRFLLSATPSMRSPISFPPSIFAVSALTLALAVCGACSATAAPSRAGSTVATSAQDSEALAVTDALIHLGYLPALESLREAGMLGPDVAVTQPLAADEVAVLRIRVVPSKSSDHSVEVALTVHARTPTHTDITALVVNESARKCINAAEFIDRLRVLNPKLSLDRGDWAGSTWSLRKLQISLAYTADFCLLKTTLSKNE